MNGWVLIASLVAGVSSIVALWRRWERLSVADPHRDPGARRVTAAHRAALTALLASPTADATGDIERGLSICAIDDWRWWRAGLRSLAPLVSALPDDADGRSLRALVSLRLGELTRARALLVQVPPDHWRGCLARAALYEVTLDSERAESALVAAKHLAPPERTRAVASELDALRKRTGRAPHPHQMLWESACDLTSPPSR